MSKKIILLVAALVLAGAAAFGADLSISSQVNVTSQDYANNFLTFKGAVGSVMKDQFGPGADANSGASKLMSTEFFNPYRSDVMGKKTLPSAVRNLFLYGIANNSIRVSDDLTVLKAADGTITIRSVHRGTAYQIVTDNEGKIQLPNANCKTRNIGTVSYLISTDFSSTGKVADIDWAKVWDANVAGGKVIGTTTSKTGNIVNDTADSSLYVFAGALQVTFDGTYLKVSGELNVAKR
jgi:hypothetical protein